jgi:hypothetical protein
MVSSVPRTRWAGVAAAVSLFDHDFLGMERCKAHFFGREAGHLGLDA